ncbi:MAG: cytochrome c biogenesis protein CcsA [bacterium]
MIASIPWLIWVFYGIVSLFYFRDFLYKEARDRKRAQQAIVATLVAHAAFLIFQFINLKRIPVATVSEALGTFVWLTALIYWLLERGMFIKQIADRSMGTFILPGLWILFTISNVTYKINEPVADVLQDVRFEIHVLAMLLSYGAFAISFIASLLYTFLAREIKKRDLRLFYSRLPSLAFFDKISNAAVDIGLLFATLGSVLGFYSAFKVWDSFFLSDPKFLVTLLSWLIYCVHFTGRKLVGWSGQLVASISLVGFSTILFSFVIISLLFTSLHRFI